MAPETHTRYRVQRLLIRLGEWLERNEAALTVAADVINEAHDLLVERIRPEQMPTSDIVEVAGFRATERSYVSEQAGARACATTCTPGADG